MTVFTKTLGISCAFILWSALIPAWAQNLFGYIRDADSGEELIGATLFVPSLEKGTITNSYGFYSINLPDGTYNIRLQYLGYKVLEKSIKVEGSVRMDFQLKSSENYLSEIEIIGSEINNNRLETVQPGYLALNMPSIRKLPAIFGEVDILKTIQLLPGVHFSGEGSSNFFVRGGNYDQNLILLDEAPVYNPSHLMGFFSAFNSDAIKHMEFYKSGIPASFGGNLSSVLDIRMKEGDKNKTSVFGSIGTISSKLGIEGPLNKGKGSFILTGRRTYADLFLKFSPDEYTRKTAIYFYDFNAKFNYQADPNNRFFISGYFGRDENKIKSLPHGLDWGNTTMTVRWNHLFSEKFFSNFTLLSSQYRYNLLVQDETDPFDWESSIQDFGAKFQFSLFHNSSDYTDFGGNFTLHHYRPGVDAFTDSGVPESRILEHAWFVSHDNKLSPKLNIRLGLRIPIVHLLGTDSVYVFNQDGELEKSKIYGNGDIFKTYTALEPRVALNYSINSQSSLKGSYDRTAQFYRMLSGSELAFSAMDILFPVTEQIGPQYADQLSFGYYRVGDRSPLEWSAEIYYKLLKDIVEYRDHARLIRNPYLESELVLGSGRSYGIELMVKKSVGKLTGWISYNYSRVFYQSERINDGEEFQASFDQPHKVNLTGSYKLSDKWLLSLNWIFVTGRPVTLPEQTFVYNDFIVPVYGERNSERIPPYHRLDLSATLYPKPKKNGKERLGYWNFTLYNAYNRLNAAYVFVGPVMKDIDLVADSSQSAYQKLSIFGIIPSISYHFRL